MKVFEEKHKLRLPPSHGRSKGLHVSVIIRDLAINSKVLVLSSDKMVALELQDTSLMQVGLAWEDYMEKSDQHPEIEYHPGELVVHTEICALCGRDRDRHFQGPAACPFLALRIFMSPDGMTWEDNCLLLFLNELKFTKKSCRDFAQGLRIGSKKSLMYVWQVAAYLKGCHGLAAKLHVLFINGNYSFDPDDPEGNTVYKIFRMEFTEEEIEHNWRMLCEHARDMITSGRYKHDA